MGMLVNPFWGRYTTTAKDYNGSTYFTASGTSLGSMPDGKAGTCAFWFRVDAGSGDRRIISADRFAVRLLSSGPLQALGGDSGGTTRLDIRSNTTFGSSATWHHFAASWNVNTPVGKVYIDGVDDTDAVNKVLSNATIDYDHTGKAWYFGAVEGGTLKWNGCLSEFFFHDAYLDLSTAITLFRGLDGKPVNPGDNGNVPFGTQPRAYMPDGDPANNLGSEGSIFTLTAGALTACSSSPSD